MIIDGQCVQAGDDPPGNVGDRGTQFWLHGIYSSLEFHSARNCTTGFSTIRCSDSLCFPLVAEFLVPEAVDDVIVYHAYGLHEGVTNRWPDELEPSLLQIRAHGNRLRGAGGNIRHLSP